MFGYITINKPELKIREFERYHAYYCGLCRDLKRDYGLRGQATLSYDLTFLGILLSALYEPEEKTAYTRCVPHPLSKHLMLQNRYTAYAAAMNVLLAYHKARDDRYDERSLKGNAMSALLKSNYRKIVKQYPVQAKAAALGIRKIRRLERTGTDDMDACAGCFGEIFATVFACEEDVWAPYLRRLGFYLGKYIYLLDAYDDIEKDLKTGNYNPFRNKWNTDHETFDEDVRALLTLMISESARAFEALPVLRDAELIRNILYTGVWGRFYDKNRQSVIK